MISLILMILCGVFKTFMDISAHDKPFWFMEGSMKLDKDNSNYFGNRKFDWWYMDRSWRAKYKNDDPSQGEKFLFSTGALSFLCDGWHLFQFFFLNTFILAIVLYKPMINWWADFLIYAVVMKGTFQLCYKYILVKR